MSHGSDRPHPRLMEYPSRYLKRWTGSVRILVTHQVWKKARNYGMMKGNPRHSSRDVTKKDKEAFAKGVDIKSTSRQLDKTGGN